ncbi:MAG TPA: CrcB family protein [Oceanipulchritudo sp.]|nr:CrcB family protein [Oceanipulchritudo sp.]
MSLLGVMAVGLGGAFGALLRALIGRWIRSDFPYATLLVNVGGSFLLALAYSVLPMEAELSRALIGSGFCGALTTFSTFILETVILARSGQWSRAILYLSTTLFLCCLASWLGFSLMA